MKVWTKINRGALLTAIVLIGVIIYLAALSAARRAELPQIQALAADYITAEAKYALLPAQYRAEQPQMGEAARKQYLADMAGTLGAFYVQDEKIRQFNLNRLQQNLESQMRGEGMIYDYQKTIQKTDSVVYEKDLVKVIMTVNTVYDGPVSGANAGASRQKVVQGTQDTVVLQKEDGVWRVVYALLNTPGSNRYWSSGEVMYK